MKRLALVLLALSLAASWLPGAEEAVKTHQVQLNGHTFTLPVGFEIELVAGPPLVDRPIVADFDEQGRLYVVDSSGSNDKVQQQLEKKPHRIVRLEDSDGDGRFDRRTLFADRMMFPEGTLWFAGSLYVAAPPSIWKLTDTDGDGRADQRVEWFQGKTLTGCANDLHGPYLGPEGWIYWCKGAFAKQTYERPAPKKGTVPLSSKGQSPFSGQPAFITRAAHIFRTRPDGTGIEPVMTGGMDNPVKVVFTPGGERIFTTTFLQHPGGGRRDGLIHAIYGGIYGKDHDVIYDHKWTGPDLMPVLTHLGPAAPCGLVRYESAAFGPEYQDNLFATLFNLHKVTRHVLEPQGATFRTHDEDFLVSNNLDFHPTDVLEDADGSLLVIDTGGWYKLCCPTSQLHKPDVLGAIYRIRRTGAPRVEDPRGRKLAWSRMTAAELARLLDDPRPVVRRRAVQKLGEKGADAVPSLGEAVHPDRSIQARRNAVWAAARIDQPGARAVVRQALTDPDETVRQAAIHSVSIRRDHEALPLLLRLLRGPSLPNRRAAAEALGRIGDKAVVPALLEAVGSVRGGKRQNSSSQPADRVLEHSLTFALIEIADREGTAAALHSTNVATRRAALVALDQMDGGGLEPQSVAAELDATDSRMKQTAWWIASRHPEWGTALAGVLRDHLADKTMTASQRNDLIVLLARFARAKPVQDFLAERLHDPAAGQATRRIVLHAMAQANLKEVPEKWITGLTGALSEDDAELTSEAISTVRALRISKQRAAKLPARLLQIGQNSAKPANVRLSALAAVPGGLTEVEPPVFTFLRAQLKPEQPVTSRSFAADVFGHGKMSSEQLLALAETLKTAGPMELDRLLEAFAQSADENVGRQLLAALGASPARAAIRLEMLKPRLAKFGPAVQKQAEELFAAVDADTVKQRARLEQLLVGLHHADVRRGQAVFQSAKAACSTCHAIGYLGGNVGPDLTHIGSIRAERDLLEAIVFPSASFVRSYEPWLIVTKNGKVYNGILRKDSPDEVVLVTGANQEARIARDDIEEMQPSKVSVMPAGLDQQLSPQEMTDLVAFLKACK
jgi:putative membrane-bound dehydrogenase-like protein